MEEVSKLAMLAVEQVRPNGIEKDAYPQIISMIVNLVVLELTKSNAG